MWFFQQATSHTISPLRRRSVVERGCPMRCGSSTASAGLVSRSGSDSVSNMCRLNPVKAGPVTSVVTVRHTGWVNCCFVVAPHLLLSCHSCGQSARASLLNSANENLVQSKSCARLRERRTPYVRGQEKQQISFVKETRHGFNGGNTRLWDL